MIGVKSIWKRDGGNCYLCGKHVPLNVPRHHPLHASRDHVIPKVQGGPTTSDNLRLAHAWCNSRRMDMPVEKFKQLVVASEASAIRKIPKWKEEMRKEAEKRRQRRDEILRQMQGA